MDVDPRVGRRRRGRASIGLAATALIVVAATAQGQEAGRVALVIGNAAYVQAPLANPSHDASAMARALQAEGFSVIELHDASRVQMQAAIAETTRRLAGQHGVGLLYYAGHGLQLDWRNYMVPVDARLGSASDIPAQAVDVQTVLDAFRASGNRMNIVVLDSCRDNPFAAIASARGLAPIDAPPGTFLAFATAPGNVAEDGEPGSANGLYTGYLLAEMKRPEAKIEDVFKRVRLQVRQRSDGRQIPWESTSLEDDFYFGAGPARPAADAARSSIDDQLDAWRRIEASREPRDFYAFLERYPSGAISEKAQFALDRLERPRLAVEAGQNLGKVLASGDARFRLGDRIVYRRSDLFTGAPRPDTDLTVTAVVGDRVEFNGGSRIVDQMGNLVKDSEGSRFPAKIRLPSEIAVGKQWQTAYRFQAAGKSGATQLVWSYRVLALEQVEVPAGPRLAFRIEGTSTSSSGYTQRERYWIDPATFLIVRDEHAEYAADGRLNVSARTELLRYEPAAAR